MKVLGMFRSNRLELVDIEVRNGSIIPGSCPGELNIACNDCRFSVSIGTGASSKNGIPPALAAKKHRAISLMICYWHEKKKESDLSV
jgi:hypothetical protein